MSRLTLGILATSSLLAFATGCDTEAYCFKDCGTDATGTEATGTGTGGSGGSAGQFMTSTGSFTTGSGGGGVGGGCEQSNGGVEICDQLDNDCNDVVDDIAGLNLDSPATCGLCSHSCNVVLQHFVNLTCIPSNMPGVTAGTCLGDCAPDYYDLDTDPLDCEYYCVESPPGTTTDVVCDGKDDDCDNLIDEDIDLCTDVQNCGKCGGVCNLPNATPVCVNTAMPCTQANTGCEILTCNIGFVDLDGVDSTGCEYQCTQSGPICNMGSCVEVCGDQVDNDCDGMIDGVDDLSGDPAIGVVCYGDADGICGQAAHQGQTTCVGGAVECTGVNVLFENDMPEICNLADDDCDGLPDSADTVMGQGAACGLSNIYPCTFGTQQCTAGSLTCQGAINPGTESCNGVDDNCDGDIDLTGGVMAPPDAVGACGTYDGSMLPVGATTPCMNGNKQCLGGTVQCIGDVVLGDPGTAPIDTCDRDMNCDGVLTNQPNKMTDVNNCNGCGIDCDAGTNATYTCMAGACTFQACLPGFYDFIGSDGICETPCDFVSSIEACNGDDDNCNGMVDEMVPAPSLVSVCGTSPAATRPECTTGVSLTCMAGNWVCGFPANVCGGGGCSADDELCDGLDNDCDGYLNENVADFGQPCASDDGLPLSHGACRDTGVKICNGTAATVCDAMAVACSTLPGGCTESCDGIDNDCDGTVDEPFTAKGANATYFVRPSVVKIGAGNLWMYQYEASRPAYSAIDYPTGSTNVVPGSGNGYWTSAPAGETQDRTTSCSVANKVPWFNVTPLEAEQTCLAMGGRVCNQPEWYDACRVNPPAGADCQWGYGPYTNNAAGVGICRTSFTTHTSTYCNIALAFDFDTVAAGDQDGLLPTGALGVAQSCYSDLSGVYGNPTQAANPTAGDVYDITGNLREITKLNATTYIIMGGAFNTQAEGGATCSFDYYATDDEFKFIDTGFRCCFTTDPRL